MSVHFLIYSDIMCSCGHFLDDSTIMLCSMLQFVNGAIV